MGRVSYPALSFVYKRTMMRARAGLVRARTALVNTARSLAKIYGERLRGCNVRNMDPEKAAGLKLAERGGKSGKKRAIIATARKLAVSGSRPGGRRPGTRSSDSCRDSCPRRVDVLTDCLQPGRIGGIFPFNNSQMRR